MDIPVYQIFTSSNSSMLFATLGENVTITSDDFIDMSSYFDMSNLSFAAR